MKGVSLLTLLFIVLVWALISYFEFVTPLFLPSPAKIARSFPDLFSSSAFWKDLTSTLVRWLLGFLIGTLAGTFLGLTMGLSSKLYDALELIVDFFRSIPPIALFPLFLLLLGLGDTSKIGIAAWTALLPMTVGTIYAVRHVRETRLMMARVLRANRLQVFFKFILPDALPEIVSSMRIALSLALIATIATEMIMGTTFGLGKRIFDSGLIYEMPQMYACILVAGCLGYGANRIFLLMEHRLVHWSGKL